MAIQPDEVADRSAPEPVTRDPVQPPENVPQREVDPRDGGRADDALTVPEVLPPHHLPQMLDAGWVFTNEQLSQILNCPDDAARVPFQCRFTPPE